ncbi:hypothetical protein R0381_002287 [Jeongeupia wiesaeckerbachi]|uniref:hypothetical protein n=1 Tax=Jeongeupia wiesaeckerbachi TaxID=3051218 RepID=UPI003D8052D9
MTGLHYRGWISEEGQRMIAAYRPIGFAWLAASCHWPNSKLMRHRQAALLWLKEEHPNEHAEQLLGAAEAGVLT